METYNMPVVAEQDKIINLTAVRLIDTNKCQCHYPQANMSILVAKSLSILFLPAIMYSLFWWWSGWGIETTYGILSGIVGIPVMLIIGGFLAILEIERV